MKSGLECIIQIFILYRHMVCNVSVICKANRDRNQLERGKTVINFNVFLVNKYVVHNF